MSKDLQSLLGEVPPKPNYNPTQSAVAEATASGQTNVVNVLKQFSSMPPSTGIIANPVRYKGSLDCNGTPVLTDVRSFTIRGILFEEDVVTGAMDTINVIFAGLFGWRAYKAYADPAKLYLAIILAIMALGSVIMFGLLLSALFKLVANSPSLSDSRSTYRTLAMSSPSASVKRIPSEPGASSRESSPCNNR